MQNLIVLCPSCFSWVEPQSEICPECAMEIDLERPDPDKESLAEILGIPISVLGVVQIERRNLPNFGHLIETTEGILFLPRLHRRINGAWEGVVSYPVPSWWPFRGDHSSPRFLRWLRRPFGISTRNENPDMGEPEQEADSLVDRLLDSPGAFFVAHRMIRTITARRRSIQLDRSPLRSIRFFDQTEDASLMMSLRSLSARKEPN